MNRIAEIGYLSGVSCIFALFSAQGRLTHEQRLRPSLYCVFLPQQIKMITRKKSKCLFDAAVKHGIKPNMNFGIKFTKHCRILGEYDKSTWAGFILRICGAAN